MLRELSFGVQMPGWATLPSHIILEEAFLEDI